MSRPTRTITCHYEDATGEHAIAVSLRRDGLGHNDWTIETDLSDVPDDEQDAVRQHAIDGYLGAEARAHGHRSGPALTEARHRELGRVRLHVRIRAESMARLDALCAESGYTRPEQIEALIDCERVTTPHKR